MNSAKNPSCGLSTHLAQLFFIYSKQFGTIEGQERRQRKHDVKTHLEDFQPKATHGRINLFYESEPVHALVGANTHLNNKLKRKI